MPIMTSCHVLDVFVRPLDVLWPLEASASVVCIVYV